MDFGWSGTAEAEIDIEGLRVQDSSVNGVEEIEQAVERLSIDELASFRLWFAKYDAARWDEKIELDVEGGKLDALAEEALSAFRSGHARKL